MRFCCLGFHCFNYFTICRCWFHISWGENELLETSREETGLSLSPFFAVATFGFIDIILLLLDLVYHNCILFDFTDVNNNNNNNNTDIEIYHLTRLGKA